MTDVPAAEKRSTGYAAARLSIATRGRADRAGDPALRVLTSVASALAVLLLLALIYKVADLAGQSFSHYGLSFVGRETWNPNPSTPGYGFGAATFLFGTAVTAVCALLIATPTSVAIALFLTELAPRRARRPVATLVELLAAIPSVVLGLWGLIVLAPIMRTSIEPALGSVLGWIPLFSGTASAVSLLTAILILTIMTVPIVSAVMRELFSAVPADLTEAATAIGATRWEMVRMVIFPYARAGMVGAVILGLGRALGEAIAVALVIGDAPRIGASLFAPGATLASHIAAEYQGATTSLQTSSLAYLALILLALSVIANVIARLIVRGTPVRLPGGLGRPR